MRNWTLVLGVLFGLGLFAGCEGGGPPATIVDYESARTSTTPVAIDGEPVQSSFKRETGKPTEFTLKDPDGGDTMRVIAAPEVPVPSNFASADMVEVEGTYDPTKKRFKATRVDTQVPTREEQRGSP